ncbi:MAG: anaerobic glycerol-3-phosphate dehydrogenase subunit A [Desulfotignum sp.]|nr:anaerobic glycerol-3-phosphate dehydrogenase subunit A [Desulfotignum sp.]
MTPAGQTRMNGQNVDVLIIGGGATGTGIARDLALRGVTSLLVEKSDINAGASGGNHGLLHSGARYVANDAHSARECRSEGMILKQMAAHCIDDCGGFFVGVKGDDETYIADFPERCRENGIFSRSLSLAEARELEPSLSKDIIAVYQVADAAIDPFMLSRENAADANRLGSSILCHTRLIRFDRDGRRLVRAWLEDTRTSRTFYVEPCQVINAAGAWAGQVASLAGVSVPLVYSKGTLLVTQMRMTQQVINRLRPPSDGDILVPGGTVSVLGTTSVRVEDPDKISPTVAETDHIVAQGAMMVPGLEKVRYIRAYSGVRPLAGKKGWGDDREVSRGFVLESHENQGLDNLITITGGKLTTFRLMAEKAADLVCARIGNTRPCLTLTHPLPSTMAGRWTEPGAAPRHWIRKKHKGRDRILCECEMISEKTVDDISAEIRKTGEKPGLLALGNRSRLGKGPCQGAFCSARVLAHLYDNKTLSGTDGILEIKSFLSERWKGQQPVFWGDQLIQAELTEAIHCGLFDLERFFEKERS